MYQIVNTIDSSNRGHLFCGKVVMDTTYLQIRAYHMCTTNQDAVSLQKTFTGILEDLSSISFW